MIPVRCLGLQCVQVVGRGWGGRSAGVILERYEWRRGESLAPLGECDIA